MIGDPLDRIAAGIETAKRDQVWVALSYPEAEALVEVARAARALQETEWIAFIGWQPSNDREQAISSSCAVLTEALARLDGPR